MLEAKKIIYCGGPFTDGLRQLSEGQDVKPLVNASGGSLAVVEFVYCLDLCGLLWAACFKFQAFIGLPPGIVT